MNVLEGRRKKMATDILNSVAQEYIRTDIPAFNVGDTVKVHIKIKKETEKESRCSKALFSKSRTEE